MNRDPFFWMTQDYEVEIRAREIQDSNQQELFCRNFGAIGAQSISVSFYSLQRKLRREKMVHGMR